MGKECLDYRILEYRKGKGTILIWRVENRTKGKDDKEKRWYNTKATDGIGTIRIIS